MPEVGDLVAGKYRVERALSSGGMGSVYVATHLQTGREFALKVMSSLLAGDDEAEARFWREAKLATSIDHPAIIEVYDVGRDGSFPFMVMKLLRGESLGERLKRGALPVAEAVDIMLRVADGVAAAHASGVVHRDLKPDNIFLCVGPDRKGVEVKVLDFGISKLMTKAAQTRVLTQTGIALGTPLYMSAEQVRGAAEVDHRTDVYALGVILYEMLTGQVPYIGNTYPDLVFKIITGETRPPHALVPSLPLGLSRVVMKAMALERDQRFQSVHELSAALEALGYARAETVPRVSSVSPPGSLTPFVTERVVNADDDMPSIVPRQPVGRWLGVGAVAAVVVVGALVTLSGRDSGGDAAGDAAAASGVPAVEEPSPAMEPVPSAKAAAPALPNPVPVQAPDAEKAEARDAGALPSGRITPERTGEPAEESEHGRHRSHGSSRAHEAQPAAEPVAPAPVLSVTPTGGEPAPKLEGRLKPKQHATPQPKSDLIDPF